MKVDTLRALAARVQAAEGADRELDAQAARYAPHLIAFLGGVPDEPQPGCARYTASLDAAMTLVPEGYDWAVFRTNGGLTIHAWCGNRDDVFAETPALALTAAALLALEAQENDDGQ